jgi:small multidrug resistance pump
MDMIPKPYLYLALAVAFEVFGSSCLQASQQLTRFWPSLGIAVGFGGAFWFFMQVLQYLPLGVTYAIWSGLGITLVTIVAYFVFGQKVDLPALAGMALIIAGIIVINVFSRTVAH